MRRHAVMQVHVVVIADAELQALPLETLSALQHPRIASLSRDLSLAVLAERLARCAEPADVGGKGKAGGAKGLRTWAPVPVASPRTNFFLTARRGAYPGSLFLCGLHTSPRI